MEDCGGCFDLRRRENIQLSCPVVEQSLKSAPIETHVSQLHTDLPTDDNRSLDRDIFVTDLAMSLTMSTKRRHQTEAEKNLNRLRSVRPEKMVAMCKMHLSFLLDLDGTKLAELTEENNKPEKKKGCSTPFSKKKDKGLFGSAISEENIAHIYQLIEFLGRPENITKEGLFRKNGNICRQRMLKDWLETQNCQLSLDDGTFTPHDVAAILKHYLAELPEQLLTERHAEAHRQIFNMGCNITEVDGERMQEKQLKSIQFLFLLLPRENAVMLECILDLLQKVSKVNENKMTSQALGTIFAPHLYCSRKLNASEFHTATVNSAKAVTFMVENAQSLFKIPRELAVDMANFWQEMEDPEYNTKVSSSSEQNNNIARSKQKWGSGPALNTMVCYIDRTASHQADATSDTQVALAQLYAHVQSLPESTKKKKLLKQFNRAGGVTQQNRQNKKHHRSKSIGESLKKHFPVLHKHRRRGSNDPDQVANNLKWSLTKPICIDIEEGGDQNVTIIKCGGENKPSTPRNSQKPKLKIPASPAVHIVDMKDVPSRKRRSNETNNVPYKKSDIKENCPSTENEIDYMSFHLNVRKALHFTPEPKRPIAMVSPITQSVNKAPLFVQKQVLTPRSRKAMSLVQSPIDYESSI